MKLSYRAQYFRGEVCATQVAVLQANQGIEAPRLVHAMLRCFIDSHHASSQSTFIRIGCARVCRLSIIYASLILSRVAVSCLRLSPLRGRILRESSRKEFEQARHETVREREREVRSSPISVPKPSTANSISVPPRALEEEDGFSHRYAISCPPRQDSELFRHPFPTQSPSFVCCRVLTLCEAIAPKTPSDLRARNRTVCRWNRPSAH